MAFRVGAPVRVLVLVVVVADIVRFVDNGVCNLETRHAQGELSVWKEMTTRVDIYLDMHRAS